MGCICGNLKVVAVESIVPENRIAQLPTSSRRQEASLAHIHITGGNLDNMVCILPKRSKTGENRKARREQSERDFLNVQGDSKGLQRKRIQSMEMIKKRLDSVPSSIDSKKRIDMRNQRIDAINHHSKVKFPKGDRCSQFSKIDGLGLKPIIIGSYKKLSLKKDYESDSKKIISPGIQKSSILSRNSFIGNEFDSSARFTIRLNGEQLNQSSTSMLGSFRTLPFSNHTSMLHLSSNADNTLVPISHAPDGLVAANKVPSLFVGGASSHFLRQAPSAPTFSRPALQPDRLSQPRKTKLVDLSVSFDGSKTLNSYLFQGRLGKGACAEVFRAKDLENGKFVVI